MTYDKPELKHQDSVIEAVQRVDAKTVFNVTDPYMNDPLWPARMISPAYEADE